MRNIKLDLHTFINVLKGKKKLLIIYICVVLMPVLILLNVFYIIYYRSYLAKQQDRIIRSSREIASTINTILIQGEHVSNVLEGSSDFNNIIDKSTSENNIYDIRQNILALLKMGANAEHYFGIYKVRFYLPDNIVIYNNTNILPLSDLNLSRIDFVVNDKASPPQAWDIYHNKNDFKPKDTLSMISEVFSPYDARKVVGYIRIDFLISDLDKIMLLGIQTDSSSALYLDAEGRQIHYVQQEMDTDILKYCSNLMSSAQFVGTGTSYGTYSKHGAKYFICCSTVKSTGGCYIIAVPVRELVGTGRHLLELVGIIIATEIIISFIFCIYLSVSIAKATDLRLKLLYSQINPHFLYNTLDLINWKAIETDRTDISEPIEMLSRYYKLTLNKGASYISVKDEFEHIALYIQLQNLRFNNSITYYSDYDPSIQNALIMNMIIQPIVENSVVHGIRESESKRGKLIVAAHLVNNNVVFTVTDDGVGMSKENISIIDSHQQKREGYGLWNIQERINLTYGEKYGIRVDSSEGVGTTVSVNLPLIFKEPIE